MNYPGLGILAMILLAGSTVNWILIMREYYRQGKKAQTMISLCFVVGLCWLTLVILFKILGVL